MYGGHGQFIWNFNKWISAVGDFGAVNKGNVGIINVQNTTAFTYGGPRFYYRMHRWSPFGQVPLIPGRSLLVYDIPDSNRMTVTNRQAVLTKY
jgi:hypothetical protein